MAIPELIMDVYLTFLREKLKADSRIPGFQGISILATGNVQLVYQHGVRNFDSLTDLHAWAVEHPTESITPTQTPDPIS